MKLTITNDKKTISIIRRRILKRIKDVINPHLYESGYRIGKIGESRSLLLYAFEDPISLEDFDIVAITENGIATHAYGGGLVTQSWSTVSIEDLFKIEVKLNKLFVEN